MIKLENGWICTECGVGVALREDPCKCGPSHDTEEAAKKWMEEYLHPTPKGWDKIETAHPMMRPRKRQEEDEDGHPSYSLTAYCGARVLVTPYFNISTRSYDRCRNSLCALCSWFGEDRNSLRNALENLRDGNDLEEMILQKKEHLQKIAEGGQMKAEVKTAWKTLLQGNVSAYGSHKWRLKKWYKVNKVEMCNAGFHCSPRIVDAMSYISPYVIALVEVRGEHRDADNKSVWSEMRLLKVWKPTHKQLVELTIFCAEQVQKHWLAKYPNDDRPQKAIDAAKVWVKNPTEENKNAAHAAAYAAAYAARVAAYVAACAAHAAYNAAYVAADATHAAADAAHATHAATYAATDAARQDILNTIEAWIQDNICGLRKTKKESPGTLLMIRESSGTNCHL